MQLPTWSPSEALVHIGTMSAHEKGSESYEGHGLSVSECPDAWEAIAKLGGNAWWTLTPRDGATARFLDWHNVTSETRAELIEWGLYSGLCTPVKGHKVLRYDDETESWVYSTFDDEALAKAELEWHLDEFEGDAEHAPKHETFDAWKLTADAVRSLSRRQVDLDETPVLVALLFTELESRLDGVYWADRLDPAVYSAPRAVIFPRRLWRFDVAPYVADSAPAFSPRFYEDGCGLHYADGSVYGAVDIYEQPDGKRTLCISEWSSEFSGKGNSVRALEWLRPQFAAVSATSVGTVDDGVPDISTMYWAHMMKKGLIDEMVDDDGRTLQVDSDGTISPVPEVVEHTVQEAPARRMRP